VGCFLIEKQKKLFYSLHLGKMKGKRMGREAARNALRLCLNKSHLVKILHQAKEGRLPMWPPK
jgi:hypothetical protein